MTRNLKALGLVLLAAFAISAVAASTASAEHRFISTAEKTVVTANNETPIYFGIHGTFEVECKVSTFAGTFELQIKEIVTVHPTFNECTNGTKVDTEDCDLFLYSETTLHNNTMGVAETDAPVTIECTPNKVIKITAPGCTITIGEQKVHGVTYTNLSVDEGGEHKEDVTVYMTLDTLKYQAHGLGCALAGVPKEGENAFVTGKYTMTGYEDKDELPPKAHQDEFKEGKQVDITVKTPEGI